MNTCYWFCFSRELILNSYYDTWYSCTLFSHLTESIIESEHHIFASSTEILPAIFLKVMMATLSMKEQQQQQQQNGWKPTILEWIRTCIWNFLRYQSPILCNLMPHKKIPKSSVVVISHSTQS